MNAADTIWWLLAEARKDIPPGQSETDRSRQLTDAAGHIAVYGGLARQMQKLVGMPDVVFDRHEAEARARVKAALIVGKAEEGALKQ